MIKNFKKLLSAVATILVLTATIAVPTFATNGIDGSAAGANRTQSDVIDTTSQPSAIGNSDMWEVSLYFKNSFQGNGMLGGAVGLQQILSLGGYPGVSQWIDSQGQQLAVNGPTKTTINWKAEYVPVWSAGAAARSWGIQPEIMKDLILHTVHRGSGIYGSTYDFMCRMIDDCCSGNLTYEDIKGKMDSGEYFKFFVSMRPHLPVYIPANKPASLNAGAQ